MLTLLFPCRASPRIRWGSLSGVPWEKYAGRWPPGAMTLRAALVGRYHFKPEFVKDVRRETATSGDKGSAENVKNSSPI